MSDVPSVHVDNRDSTIGQQIIAERVFFGGEEPSQIERDALRQRIELCFGKALQQRELGFDARLEIDAALQRLLGPRGEWLETNDYRLASVEVAGDGHDDLRLPLELLRPPTGAGTVVVRCAMAGTKTIPEGPRTYPEGGRIVLATADAGGPVPDAALLTSVRDVCRAGLHLASGSEHDRKRGAFDPEHDHLPRASRRALRQALGPRDDRPGAAVLLLVCHVREGGLGLHGDAGEEVLVGAEGLAALLEPFAAHLRLVVLLPIADRVESDIGLVALEAAMALHHRGFAAVVAPRVPSSGVALPEITATLIGSLLGDARVPPASLELALARANARASAEDGLAHLGLRLFAREADGDDTRPLVIRPYRGLSCFDPDDARFHVGREGDTQQALQRLVELHEQGRPRLLLLVGASGVGKSSLARAGILPALVGDGWSAVITRPTLHSQGQLRALVASLPGQRRLVVADQLEKLFTEDTLRPGAGRYLQCLWSLAADSGTTVVAALRIDALDLGGEMRVTDDGRTLEQLVPGPHALFVHHLEPAALRRAIVEPARCVGLELEAGLADRLVTETLTEPGALPMLELALDQLWQRREGRRMVASAYEGGLAAMLAGYANACIDGLPDEQKTQAKRILVRVATGPVVELATRRRRATLATLRPEREDRQQAFDAALAALVEARLVVRGDLRELIDARHDEASEQVAKAAESIDLSHELLLRHWDELRQWIEDAAPRLPALRSLERWVDEWHARKTLLTSKQLAYVDQAKLSGEDDDDLHGPMLALVTASRRAERRKRGVRRALLAGVGATALAFAGLSYVAVTQRNLAREQTQVAREKTRLAEERLAQAGALVDVLIYDIRPRLEQFPQLRALSEDLVDHLQQIQAHLGAGDDFHTQWNIGAAHIERGDDALLTGSVDVARAEYQAAHAIAAELASAYPSPEAQRYLAVSLSKVGEAEAHSGNLTLARELFQRDLDIVEALARAAPDDQQAQRELSRSLSRLGEVEAQAGNLTAALVLLQRDLRITETMAAAAPDDAQLQHELVVSLNKLGAVELRDDHLERARDRFQRALSLAEAMAEAEPTGVQPREALATTLDNLGDVEARDGDFAAAHELFLRAYGLREELARSDPQSVQARRNLSFSFRKLGEVDVQAGNLESARAFFQRYRDTAEALLTIDPRSAQARRDVSISLNMLGDVEEQLGELAVARELFRRSIQVAESLAKADPANAQAQRDLFVSLNFQGIVEAQLGEVASARALLQRGIAIAESLAKAEPHDFQARRGLSLAMTTLGDVELEAGNLAVARDLFRRSLELTKELASADTTDAGAAFTVVFVLGRLAVVAKGEGDVRGLRAVVTEANERLSDMDAKGWIESDPEREAVRTFFRHTAEQLRDEP